MQKIILFFVLLVLTLSSSNENDVRVHYGQASNWQVYSSNGIYVDVDFSVLDLKNTPFIFTSLSGTNIHWVVLGVTSIYNPTKSGFRVYLKFDSSQTTTVLTPAIATQYSYALNYQVVSRD